MYNLSLPEVIRLKVDRPQHLHRNVLLFHIALFSQLFLFSAWTVSDFYRRYFYNYSRYESHHVQVYKDFHRISYPVPHLLL